MTNMMKALVKSRPEPGLWMERVAVPEPGPADVLIKVAKSAICGTDVHIWNWDEWAAQTVPVPMVVGHEFSGRIAEVGSAATRYKLGSAFRARAVSSAAPAGTAGQGRPPVPEHSRCRGRPARFLRRIRLHSAGQCRGHSGRHTG